MRFPACVAARRPLPAAIAWPRRNVWPFFYFIPKRPRPFMPPMARNHLCHAALLHLLHHALHLFELGEQAVDLLHRHAGARCDAALARGLDEFRLGAFGGRHGIQDAFRTAQLLFSLTALQLAGGLLELGRQLFKQRPHVAQLLHLARAGRGSRSGRTCCPT